MKAILQGLFKNGGFHTGGVVGPRPGEVPAVLKGPEPIALTVTVDDVDDLADFISEEEDAQPKRRKPRKLKPGECAKTAEQIEKAKADLAAKKAAAKAEKLKEKSKEERWDEFENAARDLQRKWDERVAELTAELPHANPFRIWQDEESGWWRVAKRGVYVHGRSPQERASDRWRHSGWTPAPPTIEVGEPTVNWKFDPYEPTFKTFAEAQDWAKDTALLGKHQFGVELNGEIAASDLEGHEHLATAIQASRDAQKRGIERAASYEEEAIF